MTDIPSISEVVAEARQNLRDRTMRARFLEGSFFREPAWEMLIDLFVNQTNGVKISVSSIVLASGVPTTTALRHLGLLVDSGSVVRTPCPNDARRTYVHLSQDAFDRIFAYFVSVIQDRAPSSARVASQPSEAVSRILAQASTRGLSPFSRAIGSVN